MKKLALSMLAFAMMTVLPARAEVLKSETGGIQLEVPAGWESKPDGDTVQISNPDGSLSIMFWVSSDEDWEKTLDAVAGELDKIVKDAKVEQEAKEDEHNGLKTVELAGSGKLNDVDILWSLTVIGAKKPVLVLAMASPDAFKKDAAAIEAFFNSVKPLE